MKIGIVSSGGGHLTEVRALRRVYEQHSHFYVVNIRVDLPADMVDCTYFIAHSERDWKFLVNLWEAWTILRKERPDVLISAGAGCIVPFSLVGKILGVRTIFIEAICQVSNPSVSGRIMYYLADRMFYQWKPLARWFPKGTYGGPVFWSS